jgi:hypothetical protein
VAYLSVRAVAWNIAKESFFGGVRKVNNLKLRGSYGTVGNTAINPYQTLGALSPHSLQLWPHICNGAYFSNASNDSLTWETTSTANIGLDFGLFNNRIAGSIEVYKQSTNSLLLSQTLPITVVYQTHLFVMLAKREHRGVEIT